MEAIRPAPALALRILRFPLVLLVVEAVALAALASGLSIAMRKAGFGGDGPVHLLGAVGLAAAIIGLWKLLRHWLEGQPDAEFAFPGAAAELGRGLALGFGLFTAMALVVMLLGGLRIEGVRGAGQFTALAAMAIRSLRTSSTS